MSGWNGFSSPSVTWIKFPSDSDGSASTLKLICLALKLKCLKLEITIIIIKKENSERSNWSVSWQFIPTLIEEVFPVNRWLQFFSIIHYFFTDEREEEEKGDSKTPRLPSLLKFLWEAKRMIKWEGITRPCEAAVSMATCCRGQQKNVPVPVREEWNKNKWEKK